MAASSAPAQSFPPVFSLAPRRCIQVDKDEDKGMYKKTKTHTTRQRHVQQHKVSLWQPGDAYRWFLNGHARKSYILRGLKMSSSSFLLANENICLISQVQLVIGMI